MPRENLEFGCLAEKEAAEFLKSKGYKLLEINYRTKFGEIDIIARENATICFVEVKARHCLDYGQPFEAVDFRKQSKIARAAAIYLKNKGLIEKPCRFDVLSIFYKGKDREIALFKNAFENQV